MNRSWRREQKRRRYKMQQERDGENQWEETRSKGVRPLNLQHQEPTYRPRRPATFLKESAYHRDGLTYVSTLGG
ncbi:hypothetical protein NDU88_004708 [Pleurodeles waltl]|uniref:Uncharacterized protein n=1 Tax=Pleurodeles waltl TaxID=8319 RepID=A0AAV7SJJ9_PLEWA|nr:hypothetical protein NDU88_004708 [Pleurodeles waltl]